MRKESHTPPAEAAMNTATRENRFPSDLGSSSGNAGCVPAARLQAIHELIRAGNYHIPATAIADRMVELMIAGKRRRPC
jgi:anti-sigma28 factor (negative regulator of flagellin synthesis)